jgi:hypothetical protein
MGQYHVEHKFNPMPEVLNLDLAFISRVAMLLQGRQQALAQAQAHEAQQTAGGAGQEEGSPAVEYATSASPGIGGAHASLSSSSGSSASSGLGSGSSSSSRSRDEVAASSAGASSAAAHEAPLAQVYMSPLGQATEAHLQRLWASVTQVLVRLCMG